MSHKPQHKHKKSFAFLFKRGLRDFFATLFRIANEKLKALMFYIIHPRLAFKTRNNVVLVYTMGKVASNSVYYAVRKRLPHVKCFAMHYMTDESLEAQEKLLEKSIYKKMHTRHALKIKRYLAKHTRKKNKIISIVRQPVLRDVSHIFQYKSVYEASSKKGQELDLSNYDFDYTINWFDKEFKAFTGIDIYKNKFDKEKGYSIIKNENYNVLLIRFEDLDQVFKEAMNDFIQANNWQLPKKNSSDRKYYSAEYNLFKSTFKMEPETLEKLVSSKYAMHFYSHNELHMLRQRYTP